jgi:hypothetical protein
MTKHWLAFLTKKTSTEMEFFDINLTKDSRLFVPCYFNSVSTHGLLKKTRLNSGFNRKKIRESRKLESIRELHLNERKMRVRMPFKNSISGCFQRTNYFISAWGYSFTQYLFSSRIVFNLVRRFLWRKTGCSTS